MSFIFYHFWMIKKIRKLYCGIYNFPVFVVQVRGELGCTRKTLAKLLGITPKAIYHYELGKLPSLEIATKIKLLHNISPILKTCFSLTKIIEKYYNRKLQFLALKSKGLIMPDGQLILPCCHL